ncbi:hypothetical protein BKA58DRAFT_400486 [Alternaria rosae]|uniref:uncharacterized protein n=1 Tax=Alternaria rosae TaxID=1187941 RepID=UPI001E8DB768|nr:uncharacterized protein BKA58DRAFT_400486 [Alternaria rosae]KAH6872224.1 hypothetical protein BKA58DRAFT_400486 [Alternaria rosae]
MAANQEDFVRIGSRATTSSDDIPTQCTICLNELQSGQEVSEIRRCGHTFHKHCLLAWLNSPNTQHSSCTICRRELFPSRHPLPISILYEKTPHLLIVTMQPPSNGGDEQAELAALFANLTN